MVRKRDKTTKPAYPVKVYMLDDGMALVPDPVFRARWIRTNVCVLHVECPACKSAVCEPCRGRTGYTSGVHVDRLDAMKRRKIEPDRSMIGEDVQWPPR